ncbi:MAG: ABC transporter substrate-binding protein [Candidatus Promineifilaceae bacterium]|nr:ABC transporter substrate-binding protein [Candidatus Promineifilaceae bacterium]
MKRRIVSLLALLILSSAAVVACQTQPEVVEVEVTRVITETVEVAGDTVEVTRVRTEVEEQVVEVTRVVVEEVEAVPDLAADRTGTWVDTVIVVEEPSGTAAVSRLEAGDIDIYADTVSNPQTATSINAAEGLETAPSFGDYKELTLNPAACASGELNPFSSRQIREALNFAVDRDFIVQEITGGLAVPRFTPINAASADAARLATQIREIELQYAFDFERARSIISEQMEEMGATLEDDLWMFEGEPVELLVLIRTEDERLQIGDYVSNQLEELGFTVVRDYRTSAEASPIWFGSDPAECQWHVYTAGWVSTVISRDAGGNFEFFYTPAGLAGPLWQAYDPPQELADAARALSNNQFSSSEERQELFATALDYALQDSVRIWLIDGRSVAPYREEISVASDLSGSIYGTYYWPYTLRREGQVGGSVTVAMPSILTEPWNPVAGSNWIYDQMLIRATGQYDALPDPSTGLNLPHRLENATLTVQEDLPINSSSDWLTVERVPEISVPESAWVDWDAENQLWITAGEAFTETQTALMKARVEFPADLQETTIYHDGSNIDVADFVMLWTIGFDRAKEASPYFDAAAVPDLQSFMTSFKGIEIVSEEPLVIEYYSDNWPLDAENAFGPLNPLGLWPFYTFGPGAWHNVALGLFAEEAGLAAFSASKAEELQVEQLNYISGPTVAIMADELAQAAESNAIPYEPTMSQFIDEEEAAERWANLQEWFRRRGHFWIGTGPFFLQRAFPVEGNVILEHYEGYPDPVGRYDKLAGAPIPEVAVEGPGRLGQGEEGVFDIFVDTPAGAPYPVADVASVQYLLLDATGNIVTTGDAEALEDGLWQVVLSEEISEALEAGSNLLEVVVVSDLVAIPSSGGIEFVTVP